MESTGAGTGVRSRSCIAAGGITRAIRGSEGAIVDGGAGVAISRIPSIAGAVVGSGPSVGAGGSSPCRTRAVSKGAVVDGSAVRSIPRVSCVAGARESSGSGGGAGGSCKSTIVGPARHASAIINGWKRKRKKKKNGQSFQRKSSPFELIQDRLPVHTCPFPEYPVLQAHVNVSDPVELHVDPSSAQLLFPFVQLLIIVASVGVETAKWPISSYLCK